MKKRKKTAKKARGTRRAPKRPKARKRARPRATKRRKATKRGKAVTRRTRKATAGRRRVRPKRARATAARAATARAARPAVRAASAPAAAAPPRLTELVEAALRLEGYDPSPQVVDTIAAVAAGYRMGPASDAGFGPPFDTDAAVAPELVHRYATGDRGSPPDRGMHRPQVRATVLMNLDQMGLGGVGDTVAETLTSVSLGSWNPDTDEHAKRNALAGFVVRWYRDGR